MSELSAKKSFLAGGAAGLSSAVILQPFDLLKTRLQQQQMQIAGYETTLVNELRKLKHFKELWRGVLPSTLRTSIGSGIYLTLLSKSRYYLASLKSYTQKSTELTSSQLPKLSPIENLSTGFVVRAIAGIVTMPITIVKTRFESNLYNYNSMYEGIESIYLNGSATGSKSLLNFFKGTSVTLARDCPYAGLYVLFYESFKIDFSRLFLKEKNETIASAINSSSAILAASMATTITAPFDTIKTRLQLAKAHSNLGIWHTCKTIVSEPGGPANLFKGLSLRLGRKALSAGISWCIYEELIKYL